MAQENGRRFSLISPSTKAFIREARRIEGFTFWEFIHGYVYLRWPYLYIGVGKGEHPATKYIAPILKAWGIIFPKKNGTSKSQFHSISLASGTMADGYHGKVTPLDDARQLISVRELIKIDDLEQVIPYVKARAILLENPDHIATLECPCRSAMPDPCLPLDVCLVVGEPFVSMVIEHHSSKSRRITQEEAAVILKDEDTRGHVHHVFFKDAMLGRFYAICNCCSCCCGAMRAHQHGTPMLASSGYVAQVDEEECISCDICSEYCQFGALSFNGGSGYVDEEKCMGCGVCVSKCSEGAISLRRDESKGIPLEILKLMEVTG